MQGLQTVNWIRLQNSDKFIRVDSEMYDLLNKWTWHIHIGGGNNTYAGHIIKIGKNNYRTVFIHHMIVGRPFGNYVVDHINGNGLDNRRKNLRIVSKSENNRRRKKPSGKIPFHGVY